MNIQWDEQKCSHSGLCVKSLPEVFKIENGQFIIEPDKAAHDEVNNVINHCPSAALKYID